MIRINRVPPAILSNNCSVVRRVALLCLLLAIPPLAYPGDGSIDPANGNMEFQINFRYPPTDPQIANAKLALNLMSQMICDATDGQVKVSEIRLTGGAAEEDRAAFWFFSTGFRSGGSIALNGSSLITLGSHLNLSGGAQFRADVLAHEMGHHAFGLGEQYDEQRRFGGACGIGRGFEAGTIDEQNHSLMQQTGIPRCVGGTDDGSSCRWDAECDSNSCQPSLMSEFSVATNHDLVRGDNVVCPGGPITSIELNGGLNENAAIDAFDPTDFGTAQATSSVNRSVEAIDSIGGLPAAQLQFYATHTGAQTWQISAAIDDGAVGGTAGDLNLLEQWTLTFNTDGSLNSISENPLGLSVAGLTTGAADLAISLDFGTPDPGDTAGQGEDGITAVAGGPTFLSEIHDGFPVCGAADCAQRWNSVTNRWETAHQSIWHAFDSDWQTIADNYPFITTPGAALPTANPSASCLLAPTYVDDVVGVDQVLLIMDRSYSMVMSSRDGEAEVCDNGVDDDGDGATDEAQCAESRMNFVKGAARAFVDLQVAAGIDAGLLRFNHDNDVVRPIALLDSTNVDDFKIDIDNLTPGGNTGIGDALEASKTEFARVSTAGRSQTAFLLTDGFNTSGPDPEPKVQDLKDANIRVFTIPAGSAADVEGLGEIAARTGGQMIAANPVDELPAVYAELAAQYGGAGMILPRTHFELERKPNESGTPVPDSDRLERGFVLPVENGADALVAFISGRNSQMATWRLGLQLQGPDGSTYNMSSPEFTADPYYVYFRIPNPAPGDWKLRAMAGAPGLQESIALAFVENAEPRLLADVRSRIVPPSQPVRISANPIYAVEIEENLSIDGFVRRPDGSEAPISLAQGPYGAWSIDFSDYAGRGVYEAVLNLDVSSGALPFRGESIFDGPERYPIDVEPFFRSRAVSFFVADSKFPECRDDDCDDDGIPNDRECGEDTDKDGVPNMWDTDSDNDEIPDIIEGLKDRDGNNIPDACDPQRPPDAPDPLEPSIEIVIKEEEKALRLICGNEIKAAEALLERSIYRLKKLMPEKDLRKDRRYSDDLTEIIQLKIRLLKLIRSGRASCEDAKELLGPALKMERGLAEKYRE